MQFLGKKGSGWKSACKKQKNNEAETPFRGPASLLFVIPLPALPAGRRYK